MLLGCSLIVTIMIIRVYRSKWDVLMLRLKYNKGPVLWLTKEKHNQLTIPI